MVNSTMDYGSGLPLFVRVGTDANHATSGGDIGTGSLPGIALDLGYSARSTGPASARLPPEPAFLGRLFDAPCVRGPKAEQCRGSACLFPHARRTIYEKRHSGEICAHAGQTLRRYRDHMVIRR